MDKEIANRFEALEKRVVAIEHTIKQPQSKIKILKTNYKGLAGGMRLLIDNSFLDSPRTVREIYAELERESYHYSKQSVDKRLRDLIKKKTLVRFKEKGIWKYAVRK